MEGLSSSSRVALLVVDQQYDFEPGGALPIERGDEIVGGIARLMHKVPHVILTQDSHPAHHISFSSSYPGRQPFDVLRRADVQGNISPYFSDEEILAYLSKTPNQSQTLWPDHCVVGTKGWEIDARLPTHRASLILRKGTKKNADSHSAFFENNGTPTGLAAYLLACDLQKIIVVGLAGDYCVLWSVRDARKLGFDVYFDPQMARFVNVPPDSQARAIEEIRDLNCKILDLSKEF